MREVSQQPSKDFLVMTPFIATSGSFVMKHMLEHNFVTMAGKNN